MSSENHELSLDRHLNQIRGFTIKVCFHLLCYCLVLPWLFQPVLACFAISQSLRVPLSPVCFEISNHNRAQRYSLFRKKKLNMKQTPPCCRIKWPHKFWRTSLMPNLTKFLEISVCQEWMFASSFRLNAVWERVIREWHKLGKTKKTNKQIVCVTDSWKSTKHIQAIRSEFPIKKNGK